MLPVFFSCFFFVGGVNDIVGCFVAVVPEFCAVNDFRSCLVYFMIVRIGSLDVLVGVSDFSQSVKCLGNIKRTNATRRPLSSSKQSSPASFSKLFIQTFETISLHYVGVYSSYIDVAAPSCRTCF